MLAEITSEESKGVGGGGGGYSGSEGLDRNKHNIESAYTGQTSNGKEADKANKSVETSFVIGSEMVQSWDGLNKELGNNTARFTRGVVP